MSVSRAELLAWVVEENADILETFLTLDGGRRVRERHRPYNMAQRAYALSLIDEHGFNATCRMLKLSHETLYRWCKMYGKVVPERPPWLDDGVGIRRRRKERWKRRGYC